MAIPRRALIVDGVGVAGRMLADVLGEAGWRSELTTGLGEARAAWERGVVKPLELAELVRMLEDACSDETPS